MDPNAYKNLSEQVHRRWLAKRLGMQSADGTGIDLWDDRFAIELKTSLERGAWAVHTYQYEQFRDENPGKSLYWAFMHYELGTSVRAFTGEANDLERRVAYRETFFMPWDWIRCLPVASVRTGPYQYVKRRHLHGVDAECIPQTFVLLHRRAALVLPTGSDLAQAVLKA